MHGILVTLLAGLSAVAVAQSLADLPTCAQGCVGSSVSVPGCGSFDIQCICSNADYLSGLSCCLASACSTADQQLAVSFASSLCTGVGVTVPSQVVCSTASAPASSATAAAAPATASTTTPTAATTTGSGVAAPTGTGTGGSTGGNSTSVGAGQTPTAPAGSNAAASIQLGAGLSLAGMAAVVMALL